MGYNVLAVGVRCRLWNTNFHLKTKFDMESNTSTNHENGNGANRLLAAGRSCINCKSYYFAAPQHDQPYPEFACLKGHWDGISCKEHYDELFNEINCEDFTPYR